MAPWGMGLRLTIDGIPVTPGVRLISTDPDDLIAMAAFAPELVRVLLNRHPEPAKNGVYVMEPQGGWHRS